MTRKKLKRAAAYLRASTKGQDTSTKDQRTAIKAYAKEHGYKIVRWYEDDGISGDETEKRVDFLRMREDAASGEFDWILCWDQNRFGRFDSLDAGYYIKPMRDAGVQLVTINEGLVDWNADFGRLMYSIKQEAAHDHSVKLSKDVLRGQSEAAKAGSWIGAPPYGYTLTGRPKKKQLVVDEPRMAIVRRVFAEYVKQGRSMAEIARRLTKEGQPTPRGNPEWRGDTIKWILDNPTYIGTYRYNRYGASKYHSYRAGGATKGGYHGRKPKEDWVVIHDHHPAEIDKDVFKRAQSMLAKNRNGQTNYPADDNPYLFSCVLRCGRCGHVMVGDDASSGKPRYRCGNRTVGKRCEGTVVSERDLLEYIHQHLASHLIDEDPELLAAEAAADRGELTPETVPKTFARLRRTLTGKGMGSGGADLAKLQTRVKRLDAKLDKLRRNLGYADDEATAEVIKDEIAKNKEQRDAAQRQLAARPTDEDVNDAVLDLIADLMYLDSGDPDALRRVLRDVDHIEVATVTNGRQGNGKRHTLKALKIVWCGVGPSAGKVNSRRTD